jgi:hypothetical protein
MRLEGGFLKSNEAAEYAFLPEFRGASLCFNSSVVDLDQVISPRKKEFKMMSDEDDGPSL